MLAENSKIYIPHSVETNNLVRTHNLRLKLGIQGHPKSEHKMMLSNVSLSDICVFS